MLLDKNQQQDVKRGLLYILTGDQSVLPKLAKRKPIKRWKPEFVSSWKPETLQDKSRAGGTGPANPGMNEAKAWQREHQNGNFESRSDRIEEFAKRAGYFRILSNRQNKPFNPRQSTCHRNMTSEERNGNPHPNIGPDIR